MRVLAVNDRVTLRKGALSLPYIAGRHFYTNMYEGKAGKIIGFTSDCSKIAIEFDDVVFTDYKGQRSSHDTGCHGRGKLHYCWYIPAEFLNLESASEDELLLLL